MNGNWNYCMNILHKDKGLLIVVADRIRYKIQSSDACDPEAIIETIKKYRDGDRDHEVTQLSYNGKTYNYMIGEELYVTVSPDVSQTATLTVVTETPEMYAELSPKAPEWVENIFNGTAKGEEYYLKTKDFYLMPDFKWNRKVSDLYLLALFSDPSLRSVRDLRGADIPLLHSVKETVLRYIKDTYELDEKYIRIFVHYPPSAWRLHIHFQHVSATTALSSGNAQAGRAILLDTILHNLHVSDTYYRDAPLTSVVYVKDTV